MSKTPIVPAEIEELPLPFSPAIRSGEFVFVSGQAAVDSRGQVVSGTFEDELRLSFDNLELVLGAAGCTLEDVVQVRAYLGDVRDAARFNTLYREYFAEPLPARTTLVECIGPLKFEIDAVARMPRSHHGPLDEDMAPPRGQGS
jgi:2-iminobutanoate/2-iminopropanoate deaminase